MNKKLIIIVEDEEKTRFSLSLIMKLSGYKSIAVENGELALQKIIELKSGGIAIDLLICDIQMPKMTGEELIFKLRELNINIPILVITGFGDKASVVRLMRLGIMDFLDKPFESTEIEKHVNILLDKTQNDLLLKKRQENLALVGDNVLDLVHDLRNVLGSTSGLAEMLVAEHAGDTSPCCEMLSDMANAIRFALNLCNQMMKIKKGDTHSVQFTTDIKLILNQVVKILKVVAPSSIKIENFSLNEEIKLTANSTRINQVLLNLGLNSIHAMPDGGTLSFQCSYVNASREIKSPQKNCLCLQVSDTGTGIASENIPKLFNEDFTTKADGNGIGLSVVKNVLDEHEGWIEVKSELGKGTEFKLFFPVSRTQDQKE